MYKSPINIYETTDTIRTYIINKQNEDIYHAVISYGISVDKGELLRALHYDRNQYDKGYADGVRDAKPKWIPVTERLPEAGAGNVLVVKQFRGKPYVDIGEVIGETACCYSDEYCIRPREHIFTHWMPLPEPPKE